MWDKDGSTDGEFVDSDYEVDDDDDDLFYDNVDDGVVDEGAAKGMVLSKGKKRNAPSGKQNMATDRECGCIDSTTLLSIVVKKSCQLYHISVNYIE